MVHQYFPIKNVKEKDSLSIKLFGNRIHEGQTMEEYLLEFLLVFVSGKTKDNEGKLKFHTVEQIEKEELKYYTIPRMGLKRFVFYDRSKRESRTDIDTAAYERMMDMLKVKSTDNENYPLMLQDMLYGYSLVIKNRGWHAQSLLPIAPELIFPEALGIKARKSKELDFESKNVETLFDYTKHDFLARGGELYYLHLLYGITELSDGELYREKIEAGLQYMLTNKSATLSKIADSIQSWWIQDEGIGSSVDDLTQTMQLGYINCEMGRRAKYSLSELATFLSNELHPIVKIELLSCGVMLAILRMMHLQAFYTVNPENSIEPFWIIDMRVGSATSNIGILARNSYKDAYEIFGDALHKLYSGDEAERFRIVNGELKHTADVFKKMSKEIQLVIPPKGNYERFSLSEPLVRFLVLSIVKPKEKMTLDTFLDKLYEHYGMIIGPEQYRAVNLEIGMTGYFEDNKNQFQGFLKSCGLLHDLSDATSIVVNPYSEVIYQ